MTKFLFTPPNSYHPNGKAFTHGPRKNLEIFFLLVKLILPPVDCNHVDWSSWSECSTTCGNGTETRNKNTTECSHVNETQLCNKGSCPGIHSCYDSCTDLVNNFLPFLKHFTSSIPLWTLGRHNKLHNELPPPPNKKLHRTQLKCVLPKCFHREDRGNGVLRTTMLR